jgi:uncharacterized protein
MKFQKESGSTHSILGYDEHHIKIGDTLFSDNLLVNKNQIISPWPVQEPKDITVEAFINLNPKIIIIGMQKPTPLPLGLISKLTQYGIGIELMTLGAACRTFNVLLAEDRDVLGGFIF